VDTGEKCTAKLGKGIKAYQGQFQTNDSPNPSISQPSPAPTPGALTCHPSIPGGLNVALAPEDAEDSAARCSVRAGAKVLLPVVKVGAVRQSLQPKWTHSWVVIYVEQ